MSRIKNITRYLLLLYFLSGMAAGATAQEKNDFLRFEAFSDSTKFRVSVRYSYDDFTFPPEDRSHLGIFPFSLNVWDAKTNKRLCRQSVTVKFSGIPSYMKTIKETNTEWDKQEKDYGWDGPGPSNGSIACYGLYYQVARAVIKKFGVLRDRPNRSVPYNSLPLANPREIDSLLKMDSHPSFIYKDVLTNVDSHEDYTIGTYYEEYDGFGNNPGNGDYFEHLGYVYILHPPQLPGIFIMHDFLAGSKVEFRDWSWSENSVRPPFEKIREEFDELQELVHNTVAKEFVNITYTIEAGPIKFSNDAVKEYYESYIAGHPIELETGLMTEKERKQTVKTVERLRDWLLGKDDSLGEHTPEKESVVRDIIAILTATLLANAAASGGGGAVGGMFGGSGAGGGAGSGGGGGVNTTPIEPKEPENEWNRLQNRYMRRRKDGYDVTDPATGRTVHFSDNGDGTYTGPNDWGTLSEEQIVNEVGYRERNAGISAQDQLRAEQNVNEQRQQEQARQERERERGHIESISAEKYREWKAEHDEQLKKEMERLDLISKYGTDKKGLIKTRLREERMAAEQDYKEAMARADINDKIVTALDYTGKGSDLAVNVLADLTGPQGSVVKDTYTMLKSIGKHVGEAAATKQTTAEDLFKAVSYGTAQGGLGMLSNHAGDFGGKLGGWGETATNLGTSMASAGLDAYKNGTSVTEAMGQAGLKQMYATGLGKLTSPIGKVFGDTPLANTIVSNATDQFHSNFSGPAIDKSVEEWRKTYINLIDRAVQISNETASKK